MGKIQRTLIVVVLVLLIGVGAIFGYFWQKASSDLNAIQNQFDIVNNELTSMREIYPPGDFDSLSELEKWVSKNIQPETDYLGSTFRSALVIQAQGLKDGYLISVMYDQNTTSESWEGVIWCGALVDGGLYVWPPYSKEVFDFFSWLTR